MDQIVNIELTAGQVNVILAGLAELPLKVSMETFVKVKEQAESQLQPLQS